MIKAVAATLTALMLTGFMLRDRTWTDSATTLMVAILWVVSAWMWWRWARIRDRERGGDASDGGPGAPGP